MHKRVASRPLRSVAAGAGRGESHRDVAQASNVSRNIATRAPTMSSEPVHHQSRGQSGGTNRRNVTLPRSSNGRAPESSPTATPDLWAHHLLTTFQHTLITTNGRGAFRRWRCVDPGMQRRPRRQPEARGAVMIGAPTTQPAQRGVRYNCMRHRARWDR